MIIARKSVAAATLAAGLAAMPPAAHAQLAISGNDGKVKLENGVVKVIKDGADTVSLIDIGATPIKIIAEVKAPASVAGPPLSVAIGPKEDIALVTAAMKVDGGEPAKLTPDDILTVIEIVKTGGIVGNLAAKVRGKEPPPQYQLKVLSTVKVGKGAAGVTINRAGTLALVANRLEGTVSVLEIKGKSVTAVGEKLKLGDEKSGPSAIAITPDGKTAFVTRDGDNKISVLAIEGTSVTDTKREISAGVRPYGIDISPKGDFVMAANLGPSSGDTDTVSMIDPAAKPPRVVNTVSVGSTPEGIKISPDGNHVAIVVVNGTNLASSSPFYSEKGKLVVLRRQGRDLTRVAEADIGRWCQGAVWNAKSNRVVVQCMVEQQLMVFNLVGRQLQPAGTFTLPGGPAGIRTAEK